MLNKENYLMKFLCLVLVFSFYSLASAEEKFEIFTTVNKAGAAHTGRILAFSERRGIFYYWVQSDVSSFRNIGYDSRGTFSHGKEGLRVLKTDFGKLFFRLENGILVLAKTEFSDEELGRKGWVLERRDFDKLSSLGVSEAKIK